jgi:hypothetical protein
VVKKKQKEPLSLDTFVWKATGPGSDTPTMRGIRETAAAKSYQWFCENFMECAIPSAEWKIQSRKKRLSEYVTTTLEAFAIVVVYYNSFDVWNQGWSVETSAETAGNEGNDDVSTLTAAPKCAFRFTGDSKGSRKYEWWNSDGVGFYNQLLSLVEKQRNTPGCPFESKLLTALVSRPRKGRAGDVEDQQPKARNHMSELMRIVGVQSRSNKIES